MEPVNTVEVAAQIVGAIRALPDQKTASIRALRREKSQELKEVDPKFMLGLAQALIEKYDQRWVAYELVRFHRPTFRQIDARQLEALGEGINSWHAVDGFARTLSGPAWLNGRVTNGVVHKWARSEDLWWRRAALVSTVALNMRSHGGEGDTERTLAVCRLLVEDHEDMVVKAMSWALRELVVHDPDAVVAFLDEHEVDLAARVKREVRNKLTTGLKNPRKAD